MEVSGEGRRKILLVGEAPGATEDRDGKPFIGKTGTHLRDTLLKYGVDMRRDCWITNAIRCWPGQGNPTPTDKQISHCRPFITREMGALEPDVVILLGKVAVKSLIGELWREDVGDMTRWVGWRIPCQRPNAWVCPTWHPSFITRSNDEKNPVPQLLWERHLKAALKLEGKPWKRVPEWEKQVHVMLNPNDAARVLRGLGKGSRDMVAIDLETNSLKPDGPNAEIYSCAVSDGFITISYPWHGDAIRATGELLKSGTPIIAQNAKFEFRFLTKAFGRPTKNMIFDTMLGMHTLDSRTGITGLKFQAFVQLGQPSYDDHIKPFLKGEGGNGLNRIREAPLKEVLLYGALDALLTWKLAQKQMKQLGMEP